MRPQAFTSRAAATVAALALAALALAALALAACAPSAREAAGSDGAPRGAPFVLEGRLDAGDDRRPNGARFDAVRVRLLAGTVVTVDLTSRDFDAYLIVLGSDGRTIAEVDDAFGSDARATFLPNVDGVYVLLAAGAGPRDLGRYTLRVAVAPLR